MAVLVAGAVVLDALFADGCLDGSCTGQVVAAISLLLVVFGVGGVVHAVFLRDRYTPARVRIPAVVIALSIWVLILAWPEKRHESVVDAIEAFVSDGGLILAVLLALPTAALGAVVMMTVARLLRRRGSHYAD